jgi:hypothetical protein
MSRRSAIVATGSLQVKGATGSGVVVGGGEPGASASTAVVIAGSDDSSESVLPQAVRAISSAPVRNTPFVHAGRSYTRRVSSSIGGLAAATLGKADGCVHEAPVTGRRIGLGEGR